MWRDWLYIRHMEQLTECNDSVFDHLITPAEVEA